MSLNVIFSKSLKSKADTAVVFIYSDKTLSSSAKEIDKATNGLIGAALKSAAKFSGKSGETLVIPLMLNADFDRVVCLGLGRIEDVDRDIAEMSGGKLFQTLESVGAAKIVLFADEIKALKKIKNEELSAHIAAGIQLKAYKFVKYKSKSDENVFIECLNVITSSNIKTSKIFSVLDCIIQGVYIARDLVNEPPNHLSPVKYVDFINKELKPLGIDINVLDEVHMKKLGMGGILAVGQGSVNPPRMVIMRWNGSNKKKSKTAPVALVGKGVTFDAGGISVKPAAGMDEMKMDMGGSAAVVGTMKAIALRKAKVDVVAIVGLAENMPSGSAYRPGDVIKSYSGKTIEILNTDAEGRLVLADCLTYVQKKYKPCFVIDVATLTGAMMVALGHEYCGTFVNDNILWSQMKQASANTGEKLWRMPLDLAWKKDVKSQIADLRNLGLSGRYAGACTAAGFLEHFIEKEMPWAHMDIAGTAWSKKEKPTVPKFASGFGVRVLNQLIFDNYEDK